MSNGAQQPPPTATGPRDPGAGWIGLAALGSAIGLIASQYFPFVGGAGGEPWHGERLMLIPFHVVLIGGLAGLAGWARAKKAKAAAARPTESTPARTSVPAPADDTQQTAPPFDASSAAADASIVEEDDKRPEAITAPPPAKPASIPPDGIPTAQRLEIAAQVAREEEEDRTLVGDLSELAKAQELAELQRQHREAKKAEQAKQAAKKGEK